MAFFPNDSSQHTTDSRTMDTTSSHSTETVFWPQRVASLLDLWAPPFLFLGQFPNVLVIMVMVSKHFRNMSTSFYMVVSAVLDNINLLIPLPVHFLYVNYPYIFDSIRHLHFICSICHASARIFGNTAVALTVAMTVDRSIAVQFPLKASTLCTVRRAKIVTVCLFFVMVLMEGHIAFTTRIVPPEIKAYLCAIDKHVTEDYLIFHDDYWPKIRNVFLITSFIILIIGNAIIVLRVKQSEDSKVIGEGAKSAGGGSQSSKSRQLSIMLIIDLVSIIVCTLPFSIYMMVDESFQSTQTFSPKEQAERNLIFTSLFYLYYFNHCTNFYLYCISGSRFRRALKDVLSINKPGQNMNTSKTSTSLTH